MGVIWWEVIRHVKYLEKEWTIRNFWLTNIELQKLKSEVTEDEYKYTINEAEKKHFSYWLIIIVPFIMALVVLMFYYYFYQG